MQPKRYIPYAPPISLRDLLGSHLDVARLGTIVHGLPGAIEHGVKASETWRYLLRSCWVLGYKQSAVVTGDYPALIPLVASQVRAAVLGNYLPPLLDTPAPHVCASSLPSGVSDQILPALDTPDATYEPACDWTAQSWAAAWIAYCRLQPRLARTVGERIAEPVDPFAWAKREGYIV